MSPSQARGAVRSVFVSASGVPGVPGVSVSGAGVVPSSEAPPVAGVAVCDGVVDSGVVDGSAVVVDASVVGVVDGSDVAGSWGVMTVVAPSPWVPSPVTGVVCWPVSPTAA